MYRIIQTNGQFQVVYAINEGRTIVRILNSFDRQADAAALLNDLRSWS